MHSIGQTIILKLNDVLYIYTPKNGSSVGLCIQSDVTKLSVTVARSSVHVTQNTRPTSANQLRQKQFESGYRAAQILALSCALASYDGGTIEKWRGTAETRSSAAAVAERPRNCRPMSVVSSQYLQRRDRAMLRVTEYFANKTKSFKVLTAIQNEIVVFLLVFHRK